MNRQIQELSDYSNNSKQDSVLTNIENNIEIIKKAIIEGVKSSDVQKISGQITLIKEDVDTQMDNIKKVVLTGTGNKQYFDPNVLPFYVVSVDIIAGQPYVSVNYDDHISPVGVSDYLAGWRLILADFDSGIAEFMNEKNQYVKVSING